MSERGPQDRQDRSGRAGRRAAQTADPVRSTALRLLMDLDAGRFPASGRMEQIENRLADSNERRLFRALVLEALRHRSRLDRLLDTFLQHRPLEELPVPIQWILRLGAAQMLLMPWIPDYAAVNASVNLARSFGHAGTAGLVNAVLRRVSREGGSVWERLGSPHHGDHAAAGDSHQGRVEGDPQSKDRPPGGSPRRPADTGSRPEEAGADPAEALALAYSHPLWLVRRWVGRWGEERTEPVLAWGNELPDYWIRRNLQYPWGRPALGDLAGRGGIPGKDRVDGCEESREEDREEGREDGREGSLEEGSEESRNEGCEESSGRRPAPVWPPEGAVADWIPDAARFHSGSRPADHPDFSRGAWTIQDGSGIGVTRLAPWVRGLVVDVCAAPGTKTGALWERAEPGSRVVGLDLSAGRLRRTARGLIRLMEAEGRPKGASGEGPPVPRLLEDGGDSSRVHLIAADGRALPVRPRWQGALVDAPCSNLGVLRRRPDLKWRAREEEIARLAAIQQALLDSAAAGVAPGGWLVYSVCTVEPEETEEQRDRFFHGREDWRPGDLPEWIPERARRREGEILLLPGELGTDGTYAFIALREGGDSGHG